MTQTIQLPATRA